MEEDRSLRPHLKNPYDEFHYCERVHSNTNAILCMSRRNPKIFAIRNGKSVPGYAEAYHGTCSECKIWPEVNKLEEMDGTDEKPVSVHQARKSKTYGS